MKTIIDVKDLPRGWKTVLSNSIIGLIDNEEERIDSGEIYFKGKNLLI